MLRRPKRAVRSSILSNVTRGRGASPSFVRRCSHAAHREERNGSPLAHEKTSSRPWRSVTMGAVLALFAAPAASIAQTSSTPTFSGQAYVVQATVPPLSPITVVDTGPLPSTGGAQEASLLDVPSIPLGSVGALNGAEVAHAGTVGQGDASRSEASVAELNLTVAGNPITADFLMSRATARCSGSSPS